MIKKAIKNKKVSKVSKVTKKSANLSNHSYISLGCNYVEGIYADTSTAPAQLLTHNKDFVYACNNKIAQYLASVPIHLYAIVPQGQKIWNAHKAINKDQFKLLTKKFNTDTNQEINEIIEHPLITLLKNPNPNQSYMDFIQLIQSYLGLMGNCLITINEENNEIKELNVEPWEDIFVQTNTFGNKIEFYRNNITNQVFQPEQVLHIRNYTAGNTLIGKGNLEACINSSTLNSYYDAYQITLAKNYGMPGAQINVKNKISNREEAEKVASEFQRKYGGKNIGKPIVTFGDVDVKTLNVSPKDMDNKEGRNWSKKTICAAFGVPEDLVDVSDSNRASSVTAQNSFLQNTVFPILDKILGQINTRITNTYSDGIYLSYDPSEVIEKDPQLQAQVLNSYVASGVLTINECRKILGYDEIDIKDNKDSGEKA